MKNTLWHAYLLAIKPDKIISICHFPSVFQMTSQKNDTSELGKGMER